MEKNIDEKYSYLRTPSMRVAQYYQDELSKLADEYRETGKDEVLDRMYLLLLKLNNIVFNFSTCSEGRDWICSRLATEIVIKYKTRKDFKVDYWFKYLRLAMLHVRDDYLELSTKTSDILENDSPEEPTSNGSNELLYSADEIFRRSYSKALDKLADFLDMPRQSPYFYLKLLEIKYGNSKKYLQRLLNKYITDSFREEVK